MKWLATIALALLGGFAGAALWTLLGFSDEATRRYLMAYPEVLPRAMEVLDQRERQARIAPVRDQRSHPSSSSRDSVRPALSGCRQ